MTYGLLDGLADRDVTARWVVAWQNADFDTG
jgi:hypothetical protein